MLFVTTQPLKLLVLLAVIARESISTIGQYSDS